MGSSAIICGDNLDWLKKIPSSSIDLVYIDPPFFSNRKYEIVWGNGYELRSFDDRWKGGIKFYVEWIRLRVKQLHRVLKPTGSILLHCDHHASHRLRCMLDDVFGESNFVNEIIWVYKSGGATKKRFARKHDNIYFYSKGKKYTYNPSKEKSYNRGLKPYRFKGVKEFKDEIGWYTLVNQKDVLKFDMVGRTSKERIGYNTQKPITLIKKLIESCSNDGQYVLDCFGGGGTTAAACWETGRKFITGDVSPVACKVMANRLKSLGCQFETLAIPRTRQEWLMMGGHEFAERICGVMGWECNPKKTNDGGIDGWADHRRVPIQIKNHSKATGRPDLQKFLGALKSNDEGIFVAWDFTPSCHDFVIGAEQDYNKKIKLIEVKEVLGPLLINYKKRAEIDKFIQDLKDAA